MKEIGAALEMESVALPEVEKEHGRCENSVREARSQRESKEREFMTGTRRRRPRDGAKDSAGAYL